MIIGRDIKHQIAVYATNLCPMIIGRDIKHQIAIYATKYPILGLTGPRQAGKTTLLQEIFPDYRYYFIARNIS